MPTLSLELSTAALRRALELLDEDGVDSLDELVERLIIRAPSTECTKKRVPPNDLANVLASGGGVVPPSLAEAAETATGRLPFLTNRLNPIKVVCRALANIARAEGAWPEPHRAVYTAGAAARALGQRLRGEDAAAGRKGLDRRWVAYPVGDKDEQAILRFGFAFGAGLTPSGGLAGPLMVLGLAAAEQGRLALTPQGWELAELPSPLLGEVPAADGPRLSNDEIDLFHERLRAAPEEAGLLDEFRTLVQQAAGVQTRVDQLLVKAHPDWTAERAASERAALVGRLFELRELRVTGRGRQAQLELVQGEREGAT